MSQYLTVFAAGVGDVGWLTARKGAARNTILVGGSRFAADSMCFIAASSNGNHASIITITAHGTLGVKAFPAVESSVICEVVSHFHNRLVVIVLSLYLACD